MMVLPARLDDLRPEDRGAWGEDDLRVADKPGSPVRNDGIRQELQIGAVTHGYGLRLHGIVRVHHVNLAGRLGGDVRLCAGAERNLQGEAVSLNDTPGGGYQKHPR